MKRFLTFFLFTLLYINVSATIAYDVRVYGARGDGKTRKLSLW